MGLAGCGEGDGDDDGGSGVAAAVTEQLKYVDPRSSAVVAVDLRYDERNWEHLRAIASRALRAYRNVADPQERDEIPPNVTGGLNMLTSFAGLSFDEDVKPLLDGYVVVAVTQPPVPPLPPDVVERTRQKYLDALRRLTGQELR